MLEKLLNQSLNIGKCGHCLRQISTTNHNPVGFQGLKNISAEMRQKLIAKKKKQILKVEKEGIEPIPVLDFYIRHSWKSEQRKRKLKEKTAEEKERRVLLEKDWARFKLNQTWEDRNRFSLLQKEQEKAMEELKLESPELHALAQEIYTDAIPFKCRGPVRTLPIKDYKAPLGGFIKKDPPFSADNFPIPKY